MCAAKGKLSDYYFLSQAKHAGFPCHYQFIFHWKHDNKILIMLKATIRKINVLIFRTSGFL